MREYGYWRDEDRPLTKEEIRQTIEEFTELGWLEEFSRPDGTRAHRITAAGRAISKVGLADWRVWN